MEAGRAVGAERRPSGKVSAVLFVICVSLVAYLKLYLFAEQRVTLAYGLPLLLCLWHQDRRLLWSMAAALTLVAGLKTYWLMGSPGADVRMDAVRGLMHITNIAVVAVVVHIVIGLNARLRRQNVRLEQANDDLLVREEQIGRQNEELQVQAEELAHQNEELQQQAEELEQQAEELQRQAENLRVTNEELNQRESMLNTILGSLRETADEHEVLGRICQALIPLIGEAAVAATVVERAGDELVMHTRCGVALSAPPCWAFARSLASVAMEHDRICYVDDLESRPDLIVPRPDGGAFRSVLAAPLRLHGRPVGAVEVYSTRPQHWTDEQFRVVEWVAAQCAIVLEVLRLQNELRRMADMLEAIGSATPDLIYVKDEAGRMVYASAGALAAFGRSAEQILGRNDAGWYDDPAEAEVVMANDRRVMESGQTRVVEETFTGPGGARVYLSTKSPLRDTEGRVVGLVGVSRDITERKRLDDALRESEYRYRTLFANMTEGFALGEAIYDENGTGVDFRFLEMNDAFTQQSGLTREILGRPMTEVLPGLERSWIDAYCGVAMTGQPTRFGNYNVDTDRHYDVFCYSPAKGRFAIVFQDVSERKRHEEQLRSLNESLERRVAQRTAEAQQRAIQLQRLAGQLAQVEQRERQRLAQLLHDHLQQLLVAAKFNTNILRSELREEGHARTLRQVDELLDQSLATSRSLTAELSPPILRDGTLAQVLQWVARWAKDKYGLEVEVRADGQVDPQAQPLRLLLFQAVRELLLNVAKHAKADRACIQMCRLDADQVQITVSDEGVGLDPAALRGMGPAISGFGLFSIRERLELLGGRMDIQGQAGRGTQVTLVLPYGAPDGPAEPQSGPSDDPTTTDRGAIASARHDRRVVQVLLADDHAVVRDGLARLLQMQDGLQVAGQAADGQEAVEMALRLRPDVVLMDVSMPRLNGVEATRRIAQELPDVKIIGLSMHEQEDVAAQMTAAGAIAYLTKTAPPEELIATIRGCTAVS